MGRSREAIDAAVLAAAIRIHAGLETNIGAVVPRDDRLRVVAKELRLAARLLLVIRRIDLNNVGVAQIDMEFFEAVGGTPGRPAPVDRGRWGRLFLDDGNELLFCLLCRLRHATSSHEHIPLSSPRWIGRSAGDAEIERRSA